MAFEWEEQPAIQEMLLAQVTAKAKGWGGPELVLFKEA